VQAGGGGSALLTHHTAVTKIHRGDANKAAPYKLTTPFENTSGKKHHHLLFLPFLFIPTLLSDVIRVVPAFFRKPQNFFQKIK